MGTHKSAPHHFHRHVDLDDGAAFLPDFRAGSIEIKDGDVEAFGEEFITGATSGEAVGETARDESYTAELGGLAVDDLDEDDEISDPRLFH